MGAGPAAPVVGERLQAELDLLTLVPRAQLVGPGARLVARLEPLAEILRAGGLRVEDVRGVVGGGDQVERRGVLQLEDDRLRVGRVDRLHRAPDVGGALVQLHGALDRRLHVGRRHRPAGVELHAALDRERPRLAVLAGGPRCREQRFHRLRGGVVPRERLVHVAHRDDLVRVRRWTDPTRPSRRCTCRR